MKRILLIISAVVLILVLSASLFLVAGAQGFVRLPTGMVIVSRTFPAMVDMQYVGPGTRFGPLRWALQVGYIPRYHQRTYNLVVLNVHGPYQPEGTRPVYMFP